MRESSILAACQWLLDELHAEASVANHAGSAALAAGNYPGACDALALGEGLSALREDVVKVMERLQALFPEQPQAGVRRGKWGLAIGPEIQGRAPSGSKKSHESYHAPILRALAARGGSALWSAIVLAVEEECAGEFNALDMAPIPSSPDLPRWFVNAQWARGTLYDAAQIRKGSPAGMWAITEAGRRWLEEQ